MKTFHIVISLALVAFLASTVLVPSRPVLAQQNIPPSDITPYYLENFDSMGTSAQANLPANWKVDKIGTVRTTGTWSAAGTQTNYKAGNNMSTTASNGIYNYGAGPADSATDRALGWISSGSGTQSGNAYVQLKNNIGGPLTRIWVAYDVEKYRQGSNTAGFSIQMYYSLDGNTWTSAGPTFLTSFAADSNNNGYPTAPGVTQHVEGWLTINVPENAIFYLAWNYSVTSGTTTANAQALGIDNVYIKPDQPTPHSIQMNGQFSPDEWHYGEKLGTGSPGVQYYLTWDATWIYVGMIGGDINNDKYNVLIDIDPDDVGAANSGTMNEYCGATFGADGKPDYALQKHSSGVLKEQASSGSWATWSPGGDTNAASTDQGTADHVEFKIQRTDIGNPTGPIALYLYVCNNASRIWSSWPATNPQTYTGFVEELPTAIYIPALSDGKFPRYYTQWRGDQTKFDANGSFSLMNGFVQVNITSGGGTGCAFRVDLKANAPATVNDNAVRRLYTLTPSGCTPTADITLKYIDGTEGWGAVNELNGHTESGLKLWRWNGSVWVDEGGTVDTGANTVTKTGVSTFSPWTFGSSQPTAVTLTRAQARTTVWPFAAGALLLLGAALLRRKQ